jgi:hypothetical protein
MESAACRQHCKGSLSGLEERSFEIEDKNTAISAKLK